MNTEILVRNDVLKAIHIALLDKFPDQTLEFWRMNPLEGSGGRISDGALLKHVWDDSLRSPLDYQNRVLRSLEPFLLSKGALIEDFVEAMSFWSNRGSFLSAKSMLQILNPVLSKIFTTGDIMSLILTLMDRVGSKLVKGLSFPILKKVKEGNRREIYAMIFIPDLLKSGLTPWDGHLFSARLLQVKPKAFALPPFERVDMISDAMNVESILSDGVEYKIGDDFWIGNERFGETRNFFTFCTGLGLHVSEFDFPSISGVEISKDYVCPRRKRIVLRKGCFYGAPAYIMKVCYSMEANRRDGNYLFHFIDEATLDDNFKWATLEKSHARLLDSLKKTLYVEYQVNQDSIYVDGRRVINGIGAQILSKAVRAFAEEGRNRFSFREFKYDRDIFPSHKNSGFEVYLGRVREALEKDGGYLKISGLGSGGFELVSESRVKFIQAPVIQKSKQGVGW